MLELIPVSIVAVMFLLGYIFLTTLSFGSVLAVVISWNRNASVCWAIFHGWFGWFYVLYYCLCLRKRAQYS